jgi:hypothetical protein
MKFHYNFNGPLWYLFPGIHQTRKGEEKMSCFVHLICDYASGDMAWAEVVAAMKAKLPANAFMHLSTVGSFETLSTGFVLAQASLADANLRPENLIAFANCAPRKDRRTARINNEGEGLLYGLLNNGVEIVAVNSGYSLSFVREQIVELWSTDAEEHGSQFRSRDFFPRIVGALAHKDYGFKLHKLDPLEIIPTPPEQVVGYIDSFGNLKTTTRSKDKVVANLEAGERVKVIINGVIRTATVATGSFNVMEGDLAFSPGSSGQDNRYWELFKRGSSAWHEFAKPAVGSQIIIEKTT